jgi:hypothetical protein
MEMAVSDARSVGMEISFVKLFFTLNVWADVKLACAILDPPTGV